MRGRAARIPLLWTTDDSLMVSSHGNAQRVFVSKPTPGSYHASGAHVRLPLLHLVRHLLGTQPRAGVHRFGPRRQQGRAWVKNPCFQARALNIHPSHQNWVWGHPLPPPPAPPGNPSSDLHARFRSCFLSSEDSLEKPGNRGASLGLTIGLNFIWQQSKTKIQ